MVTRPPEPLDDRYVRRFVAAQGTFSETASSLANKLRVDVRITRRVLASLADAGDIERRTFEQKIEPVYYHYSQADRSWSLRTPA